jgi:pimeloyl-ACP methyl ester carboxylesterase
MTVATTRTRSSEPGGPERSTGGPKTRTLLLLPGMDGSEALFQPLVQSAPPDVSVVTVGYPPGGANTYQDLLPRIQAILPRQGPFFMLGWSFSGPLALMVAAQRPPGLAGIVLASSFVRRPAPYVPSWAHHLARPLLFRFYPAFSQVKALLGGYTTPELRALLARAHSQAGPEALACRVRAALTVDATAALAACPVPVLYLRADRDRVVPASRADEIRRLLPTLEIAELAGPHLALATNPVASWAAITAFMTRTESPSPP